MEYSIQELIGNTAVGNVNRMIPILIGKTKSIYKEALNFVDGNKTQLLLSNTDDSIIDENTIVVNLKSWNLKTIKFSLGTVLSGATEITLSNFSLTERLPNTSILIIVDNSDAVLFSTTVKEFIYEQTFLRKIILNTAIPADGTYNAYFINLETKNVSGSFNSNSSILTINTDFIFKTSSFKTIYDSSFLTYVGSLKNYLVKYVDKITQDIIDAEKNINIKAGLKLDKAAVVISYPNDNYLTELLEDLEKLNVGYYIVPIDLSDYAIETLSSYVKTSEKNNLFLNLLIPTKYNANSIIVSNSIFTV